jgi:hypothetical protein
MRQSVRSRATPSTYKKTAVLPGEAVDQFGVIAQQIGVGLLWLVGLFGSMLVFVPGQFAGFLADPSTFTAKALLGGIAIQGVLTGFEFVNRKKKHRPYWWLPFSVDVGFTYVGFKTFAVPQVAGLIGGAGVSEGVALVLAHVLVLLCSGFAAWLPEDTFID